MSLGVTHQERVSMQSHQRLGIIMLAVAIVSVPILLLISDGYQPNHGLLTSLYYSMSVVDTHICEEGYKPSTFDPDPDECFHIEIDTRYLLVLSLLLATYAVLIYKGVVPAPKLKESTPPAGASDA